MIDSLVEYFRDAESPKEEARFGVELEIMGFERQTRRRLGFDDLERVLLAFQRDAGWKGKYEDGRLVELNHEGEKVSLEPGGQLEYSTPPLKSPAEVEEHLQRFRRFMREGSFKDGFYWLSLGHDPFSRPDGVPLVPKKRYEIMRRLLTPLGSSTLSMMNLTCGTQVSIDFENEADMHAKMAVTQLIAPVATLLLSNSVVSQGSLDARFCVRQDAWNGFDASRTGIVEEAFRETFTYRDYFRRLVDLPMFLIDRDGIPVDCGGVSFRSFYERGKDGVSFRYEDWIDHLRSVFFFTRMKNVMELRTADSTSVSLAKAFAAFICGLCYQAETLDKAFEYALSVGAEKVKALAGRVCQDGFETRAGGLALVEVAEKLFDLHSGCPQDDVQTTGKPSPIVPLLRLLERRESLGDGIRKDFAGKGPEALLEILERLDLVFA